ncbi:MAG: MFS transporter, partial [Caulobacteraceae bacterium]
SQASWASVVASTYHDRSRVFGTLQAVSTVAAAAVLIAPIVIRDSAMAVRGMGWSIIIAAPIGILAACLFTPERIVAEHSSEKVTLKDYWDMVSWPEMRRIVAADFCLTLGPGWMSAMYLFYFTDSRGFDFRTASALLLLYIAAGVLGAAALSWLATRLGKHRTLMVASTGYSLGLIGIALIPRGALIPAAILMFALGFLAAGFGLLGRAMCADVGDAIRLAKGKHRQGLLYSMMTLMEKIASGLSIGLTFTILGAVGYQAKQGAHNTPAAIHNLELVYILGPIFFVMLGGACYIGYKLDQRRHAEIRAALEARDALALAPTPVAPLGVETAMPPAVAE